MNIVESFQISLTKKHFTVKFKNLLHTNNSHIARRPDEATSFCTKMANFFRDKVYNLKSSIAAQLSGKLVNPFAWDRMHNGIPLDVLQPVTSDEVGAIINSMSSKSSPLDYIPSSLLKKCVVIFAPAIANLANLSFSEGHFPEMFKLAQVTPLLKKQGLDVDSSASYRPISNLNSISKILEKLFATRLKSHIKHSSNINAFQSAYKQFYSTETALLKIMNDIFANIDNKKASILVALDLSAAFDTLDHSTILQRLNYSFVRLACPDRHSGGLNPTWWEDHSSSRSTRQSRMLSVAISGFHKAQSSGRWFSLFSYPQLPISYHPSMCNSTNMPMILNYTLAYLLVEYKLPKISSTTAHHLFKTGFFKMDYAWIRKNLRRYWSALGHVSEHIFLNRKSQYR